MSVSPDPQQARSQRLLLGIVAGVVLVGGVVVALDWRQAERVLKDARWEWAAVALTFTALSYLCLSAGFTAASRIFNIALNSRYLLVIGFITNALNNLVSTGGAAGYSVRLILMRRRGQATADILAATILHSYLNTLAVLVLLPLGLAHLLANHPLTRREEIGLGIVLGLACLTLAAVSAFMFYQPARKTITGIVTGLGQRLAGRDLHSAFGGLDSTLSRGGVALRQHPSRLVLLVGLVVVDWTASVLALGFCFRALGSPLSMGVLVTGFAIGVAAGLVSMVPGGLGVQDGSMTGIYAWLGVPLEQAVLASVLFRVVYYLIPFAVSLVFYWGLLRASAPPS
jgi:uncharacterized protein (TIRG00374 family)